MARKKMYDVRPPSGRSSTSLKKSSSRKRRRGKGASSTRKIIPGKAFSFLNVGAFFLILLLGGAAYLHFTASARVMLRPAFNDLSFNKEVLARTDIEEPDYEEALIGAKLLSSAKEVSDSFSATGTSETATKARGTVTVFNKYNDGQILVENTRFLSADSKLFYSQERITVPAGGTTEVEVVAAEAGPSYNIKPTTFSVPGLLGSPRYTSVYAESEENMQGGSEGEVAVVTEEDIERAKEKLIQKAETEFANEFLATADSSFTALPDSVEVEIVESSSSAEAGTAVSDFSVTLEVEGRALAYNEEEAQKLVEMWLKEKKGQGEFLKEGSRVVNVSVAGDDVQSGRIELKMEVKATLVKELDKTDLKRKLMGKTIGEARSFFASYPQVREMEVEIFPFWVKRIPDDPTRLDLNITLD